jgi:hypothetical protein
MRLMADQLWTDEDAAAIDADLDLLDGAEDPEEAQRRNRNQGFAKVEYEAEELGSRVGPEAASLFHSARLRSSRLMEDGIIPASWVRPLAVASGLSLQGFKVGAATLVKAGVWRLLDGDAGWRDVAFLTTNSSSSFREKQRAAARQRQRRRREKLAAKQGEANSDD